MLKSRFSLAALLLGACAAGTLSPEQAARVGCPQTGPCPAHADLAALDSELPPYPAYEALPFTRLEDHPPSLSLSGNSDVSLHRVWGLQSLRTELHEIVRFNPNWMSALLRDGRVLWLWNTSQTGPFRVDEVRVSGPEAIAGRFREFQVPVRQPRWVPNFPDYVHVMSTPFSGGQGLRYVGLWRRADGGPGSLVAAYLAQEGMMEPIRLGTSETNFRILAENQLPPLHGTYYWFTLITDARPGEPIYIASYSWIPTQNRSSRRGPRR